jgi:15-cis-phytoene desaturase
VEGAGQAASRSDVAQPDVVVAGAGLAGLSCALELAEAGRRVLLLEARGTLGGRTSSWVDDGMAVESGLHRYVGFYRALPQLLERVGVELEEVVEWEDEIEIRIPDGQPSAVLGVSPYHRPIQTLLSALGNNDFLSPEDKISLQPFFVDGLEDYSERPAWLDARSVLRYARAHGVSERAIERVLVPLTAGLFFVPPERYSALAFFALVSPAAVRLRDLRVGAFRGGMTKVLINPIASAFQRRGGQVWVRAPVTRLLVEGNRVMGVEAAGQTIRAGRVVLATSLGPAQELLRGPFGDHPWFEPMLRLPTMPAVTVQLELDRPAMPADRVTFSPGTALASFAEQSRTTFRHSPGRLSVILSPPDEFLNMDSELILGRVLADAGRLDIDLEGHVRSYRVIRIPSDFYSLAPGHDALRPRQRTPVMGLTLAGDYTRQPFMATMEGAVISGRLAARSILELGGSSRPRGPRGTMSPGLVPRLVPSDTAHHLKRAVSETQGALNSLLFAALDMVTESDEECGGPRRPGDSRTRRRGG